jgi:uncharacterized protein YacL
VITCGVSAYLFGTDATLAPSGWITLASAILFSGVLVAIDVGIPRKQVAWISSIYFGLLVGTLLSAAIGYALMPLLSLVDNTQFSFKLMVIMEISLCYLCISFLVQTRDDLRFIIPYIELRRDAKGNRPYILDTSVLIDGRIADLLETLILDHPIVVPQFAADELQGLASSSDRSRRSRGKRGLGVLNRIQALQGIDFHMDITDMPVFQSHTVDLKLIELAKHLAGNLVTNDYNLTKIAKEHNVDTINLNDMANALKPAHLPGEKLTVDLVKPGEEASQGVGYLDDGTMVVVEGGHTYIGERVILTVTSVLQTSAGRMIFGRFESQGQRRGSSVAIYDA